eukprot:GHVQ01011950.1.p1 GENE.GHVQ01011950.1~~GHVQ01011950.1.p1  ORF type:complete len:260 (+),score=64.80 GHVQ01011950.1:187-966(+)
MKDRAVNSSSEDDDVPIGRLAGKTGGGRGVKSPIGVKQERSSTPQNISNKLEASDSEGDQPLSALAASPAPNKKKKTPIKRTPTKDTKKPAGKGVGKAKGSGAKAKPVKQEKKKKGGSVGGKERGEVKGRVKKIKDERGGENRRGGEEEEILAPGDARKYFKEGQKHITPPNGDGTRAFYESLYDTNPHSLIAIKYCVEYGVLTGTKHHGALAAYIALRQLGAYKGQPGGVKQEFKNGCPQSLLNKIEKERNKAIKKSK